MAIIWIIAKIAIYTFVLNILFRQTYNFIFFLWQKPAVWIGVLAFLGVANMSFAFGLSWDPSIVSSAVSLVLLLNWPTPVPKGVTRAEVNDFIDTVYTEIGIKHGRRKYRLGLVTFAFFSAASYVLLFAESCTVEGKCTPLLRTILP
jgi:hypothetical protein